MFIKHAYFNAFTGIEISIITIRFWKTHFLTCGEQKEYKKSVQKSKIKSFKITQMYHTNLHKLITHFFLKKKRGGGGGFRA